MPTDDITKIFSDVVKQWRLADSQRMIFGMNMPQTQRAIEGLTQSLQKVFRVRPTFTLVSKDQEMNIVVKNDTADGRNAALTDIPAHLPSLPKLFKELNISSITLNAGATEKELKDFFTGISMRIEDIERQGGLKGFLNKQGVRHIKVDQLKFQLLKDDEQIIPLVEIPDKILKGPKGKAPLKDADLAKIRDTAWKDYLEGSLDKKDFKEQHAAAVDTACADPKQLEKLLKRVMKKQKEAEKFLAHLDEKLSEVGLPAETVEALKKKLRAPKKVLVPEDELARLRKLEKEYRKDIDQRADGMLDTIRSVKKKLADERERSEAMLHQLSQGGLILDKDGKILSVNATAQNILGCSPDEIRGKNIKDVLKPHHLLTEVSDWQNETDTHTPKKVKVQVLDEETLAIVRESTIVIENEQGRSIGIISGLQDVTQQEELKRRKNDILDVLGHDLRAPLGAIKQNFDVLVQSANLKTEGSDQQKKFLANCQNNIVRMSRLIEKIMDMRQLETGKIMLKYDTVTTSKLLEEAVTSLNDWAKNKNIRLKINAQNLPDIDGDPERIYQIITNLVSNALKFTPEGGTIVAEGRPVTDKGIQYVRISIKDSGMGIDADNLKRIFDKYEQVTVNTPKGVSGLGLGLSICKTIIELHGGLIWAESAPEKGSTFTFQIPVKRVDADSMP